MNKTDDDDDDRNDNQEDFFKWMMQIDNKHSNGTNCFLAQEMGREWKEDYEIK
jgi:hypothetical protein